MITGTLGMIAIIAYAFHLILNIRRHSHPRHAPEHRQTQAGNLLGTVAIVAHAAYVWQTSFTSEYVNLSYFQAATLTCLLVSAIALASSFFQPLGAILIVLFPISITSILISWQVDLLPMQARFENIPKAHVAISLIAYSLLVVATLQSLAMFIQYQLIKRHKAHFAERWFPALETQERLLLNSLWGSFILLSYALLGGVLAIQSSFEQHLNHKVVFSMVAWITLLAMLCGRRYKDWRGGQLVAWTLASFALLSLGYWGNKLVLELILQH